VIAALLIRSYRRVVVSDALLVGGFALLASSALRNVAWWGLAIAPIIAFHLASIHRILRSSWRRPRVLSPLARATHALTVGLLLLIAVSALPWLKDANPLLGPDLRGVVSEDFPTETADFLARQPSCGLVFTLHKWSSYLTWRLWPAAKRWWGARS